MTKIIQLKNEKLNKLREMNPALVSYNIEMAEITGCTFWKAYADAQIDGTEEVPVPDFLQGLASMHQ